MESYSKRLKKAIIPNKTRNESNKMHENEKKGRKIDALERILINLKNIKEYYTWMESKTSNRYIYFCYYCVRF